MKKNIFLIISLTAIIVPLSCRAFFLDNFFDDLDKDFFTKEIFEDYENENDVSSSSADIINEINVRASTGGNTAEGGEIKEGKSEVDIEVKNIINGQSIEPVEIHTEGNEAKAESRIEADDENQINVHREIQTGDKKTTEIKKIWSGFFQSFKNLFKSIFSF